jgi:hypothetical protein
MQLRLYIEVPLLETTTYILTYYNTFMIDNSIVQRPNATKRDNTMPQGITTSCPRNNS